MHKIVRWNTAPAAGLYFSYLQALETPNCGGQGTLRSAVGKRLLPPKFKNAGHFGDITL